MSRFGYQVLGFGSGGKAPNATITAKGVGGNTETDGTASGDYKYHVFNSNGTFTITAMDAGATFDYVVVAGGGGGGGVGGYKYSAGGGGAGGRIYATAAAGAVTTFAVVIGAGGAGGSEEDEGDE